MRKPDFVGVGAMRSGSTSLWSALKDHPSVFLPETKELHFFDDDENFAQGTEHYFSEFAPAREDQLTGEITPSYMFQDRWRRRLHDAVPDAKILVILRDPVKRAWSHWQFSVLYGLETVGFAEAIEQEEARMHQSYRSLIRYSYVSRGLYADQVNGLFELFGRDQVLVQFVEDLQADRTVSLAELQAFLGLQAPFADAQDKVSNKTTRFPRSIVTHQRAKKLRNQSGDGIAARLQRRLGASLQSINMANETPVLDPAIAQRLRARFEASDLALEALLGRSVPWRG